MTLVSSDIERKGGVKRKLADTLALAPKEGFIQTPSPESEPLYAQARRLISTIQTALDRSPESVDKLALRRAAHALADLSKTEENVDLVVAEGGVDAVVPLLTFFRPPEGQDPPVYLGEEIEKEACFIVGLLAIKQEHQHLIAERKALPALVALLKRYLPTNGPSNPGASVVRRAADAITNLAHENVEIKSRVRAEGGIPPLVALLQSIDPKVARASAGALRTLAFKNEDNKNQIVECGALPTLIQMLRADDVGIHYEAVGVIGNLVHSTMHIKRKVLEEGALQPVIGLLSSSCNESQREAALLLGQFATTEPDYKAKIVQRGAVPPLIAMLTHHDPQLKEMAAFALGRLAQNTDNQSGIVQAGGLPPLLSLIESKLGNLQHNAAFALYGLADNDDNIAEIIKEGGVQRLQESDLIVQASKDCVQKTLKRLEDKIKGRVLNHILYSLHSTERLVQQRVATALARLTRPQDLRQVFLDHKGLDVLLGLLTDPNKDLVTQKEAAGAVVELANKAESMKPDDSAPAPPVPQIYLGPEYVNCQTLSDVTFLVEGQNFYAHRIALLASSDTFRAMFDGHYKENSAAVIPIPNIRHCIFKAMMFCIYTGEVKVTPDIAKELLQAADQYMLEGLKRQCEVAIAEALTVDNMHTVYELAEDFNAPKLAERCVLFALQNYDEIMAPLTVPGFAVLMQRMTPKLRRAIAEQLTRAKPVDVEVLEESP
ncbi:hypothetical protein WJX72_008429 [[Myrmecia] bisecta]|uniref:BTB domain-containing protein n=1 Tax=[Myrmecia] bisecta TaxID=41462 RepID=A0AAW1Q1C6_9CHLO